MNCLTLIEKFVNDRDETIVDQLAQHLITQQVTLLDFVVSIGDYLQSSELSKRSIALTLIANVLARLPRTFLKSIEIHHLLIFVCAKMSDHHILAQPAVELFGILSKQSAIADEDCIAMIRSIFTDVYVQSFPQSNRHTVYVILLHFLLQRLDAVRQLGSDFVCNFIQSMEGERDPRNLVLCFQCLQCITRYLDIEPYKEELFDVVSCYFPMEYKPKTTNTETEETITHEQLVLSLRNVLTSTSKFAQYCIPLLIEKLESDVLSARLAAMDVFIHCIDEYNARDIENYLIPLWNLFSKQALCAESQEVETNALHGITALMQLIGKSVQNDQTNISTKKFVDRAIRECENYLKELDLKLVWPATKVLHAVARANSTCASLVWSIVLPLLRTQFETYQQINHKRTILDMMAYFLQVTNVLTKAKLPSTVAEELWILISTHFDAFPSHCLSLINNLLILNTVPSQLLVDNLTTLIFQETINDELKIKLSIVLKVLASSALFDRLCTNLLTNLIASWTTHKTLPSDVILESCVDLCHNIERCQERLERFFFPSQQLCRYLPNLFKYLPPLYVLTNLFSPSFNVLLTWTPFDQYAKLFCSKCGTCADETCTEFVENLCETSLFNETTWQSENQSNLVPIVYFVGHLRRKFFQQQLELIFARIHEKLIDTTRKSSLSNEWMNEFYGNLINKLSFKNETIEQAQLVLKQCENSLDTVHIQLWTVIVKALTLARPSIVDGYIRTLVSWISQMGPLGELACHSLKTLINFDDEQTLLLSIQADCIVHPMVKQIIFMNILAEMKPLLANNELLPSQMNMLVDLLNSVPKSIIQDELVSLLPILIRALVSPNESVWSSALNSICDLIKNEPNTVLDYIDTLTPRLTTLATYPKDMAVRITSLECLQHLTRLPSHTIQPHRRHVIHVLKTCLDDHKRLVRKQAVETQMSWYLLNEQQIR